MQTITENSHQVKEQDSKNCEQSSLNSLFVYIMRNQYSEGKSVSSIDERRLVLAKKKLFFNSTRDQPRATDCRSIRTYFSFKKHHDSICDKKSNPLFTTNNSGKY